jgi:hypothetical protein
VSDADWPLRAAFLENSMVRPASRGRGHQRALIAARADHARAVGRRWLCAGVQLGNRVSWTNLLIFGMSIVGICLDLGYPIIGLLRPLGSRLLGVDPATRRASLWATCQGTRPRSLTATSALASSTTMQSSIVGFRRAVRWFGAGLPNE